VDGLTGPIADAHFHNAPANFSYQATNPVNQPVGNPNTPVNIAAGAAQNFVISLTPTAAIARRTYSLVLTVATPTRHPSTSGLIRA
jgi:hypothetical protein